MANTIQKAALMQSALDTAMIQGAATGFMEQNASSLVYSGGSEVKLPKIDMDGLANYNKQTGYTEGDVTFAYQTLTMSQDRGRGFTVDAVDADESGAIDLMSKLAGEFQRTKVIPEVDAYRVSKIVGLCKSANRKVYTPAAGTIYSKLLEDIGAVRDETGGEEPIVVLMSTPVSTLLGQSTEITHRLDMMDFARGDVVTQVKSLDGVPLLTVPSARMYSRITLAGTGAGGYAKASGAAAVNYIVLAQRAPIAVSRTDTLRLFTPQQWQKAHAWHMDYRKFHDLWVPEKKLGTIRVSLAATDSSLSGD